MKQPFKFFPSQVYDGILLAALLFLSCRRILVCLYVTSLEYYCEYGSDFTDYILWGLVAFGSLLLLIQRGKLSEYRSAWKLNWALELLLLYSMASVLWSIVPERSIHTVYIMAAASLTASIAAVNYSPKKLLKTFLYFTMLRAWHMIIYAIMFLRMRLPKIIRWDF